MRTRILLAAIALPLCLPVAVAQEEEKESFDPISGGFVLPDDDDGAKPAAATPPPATADFSEGLKQLAALGLPDMKDAQWVKPPSGLLQEESMFNQSYEFRESRLKLKGGVWKLAGDKPLFLDFGSPEPLRLSEAARGVVTEYAEGEAPPVEDSPNLLQRMLRNHAAKNPPKPVAGKKADLPIEEADAKAIAEALGKEEFRKELAERQSYRPSPLPGRCLIFAAQLLAAGKTEAANQVANAVFALPIPKEDMIDGAVTQFADLAYEGVAKAFFEEHHDWAKYRDGVKAVLEKYPRGWDDAGAVAILLPLLEKRAAGAPAPVPSLDGVELKPEALAALQEMLAPPAGKAKGTDDAALARSHGIDLRQIPASQRARILAMLRQQGMGDEDEGPSGLWLLEEQEEGEPGSDPVARLRAMKMDGLIALAAVAADETLVPQRQSGGSDRYSYSSHQSAEQIAWSHYESLERPKTRGEIAMEWLEAVVPEDDDHSGTSDAAAVAQAAVEFWKEHRKDPPVKLALFYLNSSDRSKRSEAASFLAGQDDPEAHAAFEKAVLDSSEPADFAGEVSNYLSQRKTEARPFFEAYAKALHAAMDGVDLDQLDYSGGGYAIRSAGGVDKFLKPLAMKVGAVSLEELVATAMKSGKPAEIAGLANAIGSSPMPDCLKVVGKAAEKAKPEQLMELYQVLLRRAYQERNRGDGEDGEEAKEAPAKAAIPPETLALWRPLLARTDALPEAKSRRSYLAGWTKGYGGKNCGDTALLALELCAFPSSGQNLNLYGDIQASYDAVIPFVRKRVEAWMSGQEAPPWPSSERVSEERKKELAAKLAELPVDGIIAWSRSLPDDERVALAEILRGYDEENPPPPNLVELKFKVIALQPPSALVKHDPALLEKLGIREGMMLTPEMLRALAVRLATEAKDLSGTAVNFNPGPMGLGCMATASRESGPQDQTNDYTYGEHLAQWFETYENPEALATLSAGGVAEFWAPKDGKAEKLETKRQTSRDLSTVLAAKTAVPPSLTIQVLTREDAEKIINHQPEEPEAQEEEEE